MRYEEEEEEEEEKEEEEGDDNSDNSDNSDNRKIDEPTPAMLAQHRNTLKSVCEASRQLLLKALAPMWSSLQIKTPLKNYLTLNTFGEIAGTLTTNTMNINIASPLQQYFEMLSKEKKRAAKKQAKQSKRSKASPKSTKDVLSSSSSSTTFCSAETDQNGDLHFVDILQKIGQSTLVWQEDETLFDVKSTTEEDLDEYFPSIDGTGLYPLLSCLNHDCEPNVSVEHLGKEIFEVKLLTKNMYYFLLFTNTALFSFFSFQTPRM